MGHSLSNYFHASICLMHSDIKAHTYTTRLVVASLGAVQQAYHRIKSYQRNPSSIILREVGYGNDAFCWVVIWLTRKLDSGQRWDVSEYAMMISTRNRDEKNGPPFVNDLGTFTPTLTLTAREARCRK